MTPNYGRKIHFFTANYYVFLLPIGFNNDLEVVEGKFKKLFTESTDLKFVSNM